MVDIDLTPPKSAQNNVKKALGLIWGGDTGVEWVKRKSDEYYRKQENSQELNNRALDTQCEKCDSTFNKHGVMDKYDKLICPKCASQSVQKSESYNKR